MNRRMFQCRFPHPLELYHKKFYDYQRARSHLNCNLCMKQCQGPKILRCSEDFLVIVASSENKAELRCSNCGHSSFTELPFYKPSCYNCFHEFDIFKSERLHHRYVWVICRLCQRQFEAMKSRASILVCPSCLSLEVRLGKMKIHNNAVISKNSRPCVNLRAHEKMLKHDPERLDRTFLSELINIECNWDEIDIAEFSKSKKEKLK